MKRFFFVQTIEICFLLIINFNVCLTTNVLLLLTSFTKI